MPELVASVLFVVMADAPCKHEPIKHLLNHVNCVFFYDCVTALSRISPRYPQMYPTKMQNTDNGTKKSSAQIPLNSYHSFQYKIYASHSFYGMLDKIFNETYWRKYKSHLHQKYSFVIHKTKKCYDWFPPCMVRGIKKPCPRALEST